MNTMRLNLDNLSMLLSYDMLSAPETAESSEVEKASFESHLQNARETAAPSSRDLASGGHHTLDADFSRFDGEQSLSRQSSDDARPVAPYNRTERRDTQESRDDDNQGSADTKSVENRAPEEDDENKDAGAGAAASANVQTHPAADQETKEGEATEKMVEAVGQAAEVGEGALQKNPGEENNNLPGEPLIPSSRQTQEGLVPNDAGNPTASEALPAQAKLTDATGEAPTNPTVEQEAGTDGQRVPVAVAAEAVDPANEETGEETPQGEGEDQDALATVAKLRRDARRQLDRKVKASSEENAVAGGPSVPSAVGPRDAAAGNGQPALVSPNGAVAGMAPTSGETVNTSNSSATTEGVDVDRVGSPTSTTASDGRTTGTSATAKGEQASDVGQAERVRFVQRVSRAVASMGDRNGTIRMALYPPELGSLKLHMTMRNGTMEARLEVESEGAKKLLMDNLPVLRERLAEQNVKIERFDVEYSNQSAGGPSQDAGQQMQSQDQPRGRGSHAEAVRNGASGTSTSTQARPAARSSGSGRLDVLA